MKFLSMWICSRKKCKMAFNALAFPVETFHLKFGYKQYACMALMLVLSRRGKGNFMRALPNRAERP